MKIFLTYILPLAFPIAVYLLYVLLIRKEKKPTKPITWFYLIGIGVALTFISLLTYREIQREEPGGVYQPPTFKDGKVVPGQVIRPEDQQ